MQIYICLERYSLTSHVGMQLSDVCDTTHSIIRSGRDVNYNTLRCDVTEWLSGNGGKWRTMNEL